VNLAGFVTHSAIHGNIPSAHCVMHTHTTTGSAVACAESGLSHDTFYGAQLAGRVAYHEFEATKRRSASANRGPGTVEFRALPTLEAKQQRK